MGALNRLTAIWVEKIKEPGIYRDGGGLNLQVYDGKCDNGKSWLFKYSFQGKTREMCLGAYPAVSLAEARKMRDKWKNVRRHGADPLAVRDKEREPVAPTMTFGDCVREYLIIHEKDWRGVHTCNEWHRGLEVHAKTLCPLPVGDVSVVSIRNPR